MKKLFMVPLALLLLSINLLAQTGDDKAAAKAEKLSTELGLSAEQKDKIKNFFIEEDKKTAELKTKYKTADKSVYHKEAKKLRDETEKNIVYVLNAAQKTKYEASKPGHDKEKKK